MALTAEVNIYNKSENFYKPKEKLTVYEIGLLNSSGIIGLKISLLPNEAPSIETLDSCLEKMLSQNETNQLEGGFLSTVGMYLKQFKSTDLSMIRSQDGKIMSFFPIKDYYLIISYEGDSSRVDRLASIACELLNDNYNKLKDFESGNDTLTYKKLVPDLIQIMNVCENPRIKNQVDNLKKELANDKNRLNKLNSIYPFIDLKQKLTTYASYINRLIDKNDFEQLSNEPEQMFMLEGINNHQIDELRNFMPIAVQNLKELIYNNSSTTEIKIKMFDLKDRIGGKINELRMKIK